jgi:hypothetical protein
MVMLAIVARLIVFAVVAALVWWALKPRPVFVIAIRNGTARVASGQVPTSFLSAVTDECRRSELCDGTIRGVQRRDRIALAFSAQIPPSSRQRLRNTWVAILPQ